MQAFESLSITGSSRSFYWLASAVLVGILCVLAVQPLMTNIIRISFMQPIDFVFNEGWNVIHTTRLLNGERLYLPIDRFPLIPVNYPPVSFIVVGILSYFGGSVLVTGRVVALVSFFAVGCLIYYLVEVVSRSKIAGLMAACVWITLMTQLAPFYVSQYDPQMLAHVFSVWALFLFMKWRGGVSWGKINTIALLCCVSLYTKHLLLAVPLSIAISMLGDKKALFRFLVAGVMIAVVLVSATYIYAGNVFFSNFLDTARRALPELRQGQLARNFVRHGLAVISLPAVYLWCQQTRASHTPVFVFFLVSFLIGLYACGGVGVNVNAWFEFFIAISIIYGLVAASEGNRDRQSYRWLGFVLCLLGIFGSELVFAQYFSRDGVLERSTIWALRSWQIGCLLAGAALLTVRKDTIEKAKILVFCGTIGSILLVPIMSHLTAQQASLSALRSREQSYREDVNFLQSISGPALFENPLLGFHAGKPFLYDPFSATQLIVSGRISEQLLLTAIREKHFSTIVLGRDLDALISKLGTDAGQGVPKATASDYWTDATLLTIKELYERVDLDRRSNFFFYRPRLTVAF